MGAIACARNGLPRLWHRREQAWRRGPGPTGPAPGSGMSTAVGLDPRDEGDRGGAGMAYRGFWEPRTFTHPLIPEVWRLRPAAGLRVGVLSTPSGTPRPTVASSPGTRCSHLIDADVYSSHPLGG